MEECWDSILASRSGIAHTNTLDTADCYADYAAEVKGLEESDPTLDRAAALCLRATGKPCRTQVFSDFGNSERASVIMGSCVGGGRSPGATTAAASTARIFSKCRSRQLPIGWRASAMRAAS